MSFTFANVQRVLVCGGRDYKDVEMLNQVLDAFEAQVGISCIIQGDAKGADTLSRLWAVMRNIVHEDYPAQWNKYGRRAGFLRNTQMLEEGKPDVVIAFPGGRGTAMMCRIALGAGVKVYNVNTETRMMEAM